MNKINKNIYLIEKEIIDLIKNYNLKHLDSECLSTNITCLDLQIIDNNILLDYIIISKVLELLKKLHIKYFNNDLVNFQINFRTENYINYLQFNLIF